jgi:hypothetical protein
MEKATRLTASKNSTGHGEQRHSEQLPLAAEHGGRDADQQVLEDAPGEGVTSPSRS